MPSLLKWTGSKRHQAHRIYARFPPHRRYFEPFLGGGALLYLAARPGCVAGDSYSPLIEVFRLAQREPRELVENYRAQWERLQEDLPGYFYEVRSRFNERPNGFDLCFLMRTCVNGIARFNRLGEFNNSFHLSRPGMHPSRFEGVVNTWAARLSGVELRCEDYAATVEEAREGDFVYFDPPYAGSAHRYLENLDEARLYAALDRLNARGVRWIVSFDGSRGGADLTHPVPEVLFRRRELLEAGHSAVGKVLNGPVERVFESLYMNF
ncbi:MAG: DNA adenine methylase [Deltaproteobacteria bacterium]|nr:DNA adenine methylase [Deltaproteobacteria bacterium]